MDIFALSHLVYCREFDNKCPFGKNYFWQLILLFNLFLLLFMSPTALFGTIYGSYYTISINFYFYLQYFQQKAFSFNKISGSRTNPKLHHIEWTKLHSQSRFLLALVPSNAKAKTNIRQKSGSQLNVALFIYLFMMQPHLFMNNVMFTIFSHNFILNLRY